MKRIGLLIACLVLVPPALQAALRLGLGQAVAKRSAELIDKAGHSVPVVGDAVAATLPACSGAFYDSLPTDLSAVAGIDPLGHVQPSGHTFPSDHIYLYAKSASTSPHPVYAPGAIHITTVRTSSNLSANPPHTDYSLYFYACSNVKSYYAHVVSLSNDLTAKLPGSGANCATYSTGGSTFRNCDQNTNIVMESGSLLGYSGATAALDFGTYDYRITPLAFISPQRHYGDQPYTACPLDYFTSGLKTSMEALLGRFDGGHARTALPLCGQINFDISGTAKGDWFHVGSPDSPEDPHLALIDNNVYAPWQTISYGNSLPNAAANWYIFVPTSSGRVNRDLAQITSDGQIYCFDSFYDPIGQPIAGGPTFLIQLPTSTTLRFERQSASSCGAGPWSFTTNAVDFQR